MSFQQLLSHLKETPEDIVDMIALFHQIPKNDPHKYIFYQNIEALINLEIKKEKTDKVKIRLLNSYKSGQIALGQLADTSEYIQEAYISALGKQVGINDGRNKYYQLVRDNAKIIASVEAGSFIISVDSIGDTSPAPEIDMVMEDVNKEELFVDFLSDIWDLDSYGSLEVYIEKYGYKSLKHIDSWFSNLIKENTSFELINSYKWKKEFSINKINNFHKLVKNIEYTQEKDKIELSGKVLTIDSIKNRVVVSDSVLGAIEIKFPLGILQKDDIAEKLKINKGHHFNAIKETVKYPNQTRTTYFFEKW